MLDAERHVSLRDDIQVNGLLHPIVTYGGEILDGRNRYKACTEIGVEPTFAEFDGDPWAYVWSANGERRDLVHDQRYLIWKRATVKSAAWQTQQAAKREAANVARSEAAKEQNAASNPRAGERFGPATTCGDTERDHAAESEKKTSTAKAAASKTNRGSVERMDQLDRHRPDLADKVLAGEIKPTQALRQMKRDSLADRVAELPEGKYRVIYADPPWSYGDERSGLDASGSAAAAHYPTMPIGEICALDIASLAADDAVLFLWATFPLLPDALQVIHSWGFKYKTAMVWDKQRANLGNYHDARAEMLIIATRGACTPEGKGRPSQIQSIARGAHSAKPEEFRATIDHMYPNGPRVELFRRGEAPAGWTIWGNEIA